jgi:ABC-type branched-subunit amino acid transport system permease subunit
VTRSEHLRNLAALGVLGLVLALLPPALSVYLRSFALFTMMYVVLALSWNIISGFTGYTSFGHVIFYGIGAYACAILVADHGWHWLPTLAVAAGVAAAVGLAIGYPVLRLKGPYFAIAMLGAAEGMRVIATVWDDLTHGGLGISFPSVENSIVTYHAMLGLMLLTIGKTRWPPRPSASTPPPTSWPPSRSPRCSRRWPGASRPTRSCTSIPHRSSSSRSPSRWPSCPCSEARAR